MLLKPIASRLKTLLPFFLAAVWIFVIGFMLLKYYVDTSVYITSYNETINGVNTEVIWGKYGRAYAWEYFLPENLFLCNFSENQSKTTNAKFLTTIDQQFPITIPRYTIASNKNRLFR